MRRAIPLAVAVLVGATVLAGCQDKTSENARSDVTTAVVSDETTQDILVFAPDAEGSWPVVVALHGVGGTGKDMAEIATRLAREGVVVFAPTYRSDLSTQKGLIDTVNDVECGYRFIRSIAAEYGGDLDQPVTFVGWSLGATAALGIGLTENVDPTGKYVSCFSNAPRPDVIVAISGCYFEFEGVKQSYFDVSGWGNKTAGLTLLAGDDDTTCAAWQSKNAEAQLRSAGYDVDLVMLEGANHYAPIFHDLVNGEWVVIANDPPGERTVEVILDAIAANQDQP
jgi:dienelactone hydrolase/predicted small secreted protein